MSVENKFEKKDIEVEFQFADKSKKTFTGLQVEVVMQCDTMTTQLHAGIYGLSSDTIDALVGFNQSVFSEVDSKKITLHAIDGDSRVKIFKGNIIQAVADYNGLPNVPLVIVAQSDMDNRLAVVEPVSFSGAKKLPEILQAVLDNFNKTIPAGKEEEKLVLGRCEAQEIVLTDVALNGGLFDMLEKVCDSAGCRFSFEDNRLVVCKMAGSTHDGGFVISYDSDMIGFPLLTAQGCTVKSYFNPYFRTLQLVTVKSLRVKFQKHVSDATLQKTAFTETTQKFTVVGITHRLFTQVQNGDWLTELNLIYASQIGGVNG